MQIYNTLTRKKETFVPVEPGKVGMYACGPTVYDLIHLGNARAICVFDVMRKYLKYRGFDVKFVQNFTDVDDKIINKAKEHGISPLEHSEKMIAEYFTDARSLGINDADIHPKVTENIGIIIEIIQTLLEKGFAYESGGDVYFAAEKFDGYGKLSGNSPEDLREGASQRLNSDSDEAARKRSPLDFALWKSAKEGEIFWQSPFAGDGFIGHGRPGWHIECSAMSKHYIGNTIDIHGGGSDLIFPHHENEIAQSEAATGCPLANYWVHNGMLNVDGKKLSKSDLEKMSAKERESYLERMKETPFTVREAAKLYGYEPLRFMLLSAHYRSPMNYTAEVARGAVKSIERFKNCKTLLETAVPHEGGLSESAKSIVEKRRTQFVQAMDDDFNTADALAAWFELVREINSAVADGSASREDIDEFRKLFEEFNGVLGLLYATSEDIPQEILDLVEKRKAAKSLKDYALADSIREEINQKGYIIEETRQGVNLKRKG
ncbi:MAG: cysteine--tRNA ligase [Oscillospiraceae bacterium]|nr:cysteine--tRNA ligase [Oscillospiraceae bacterium]